MNVADYSTTELCTAFAAALRAVDALDGTGLDLVTKWQEKAEAMADTIAIELQGRVGEYEAEEKERLFAVGIYLDRLSDG